MKNLRNSLAIILALIIVSSAFTFSAGALIADEAWEDYYASYMEEGNAVILQPGSDETERNFSWYSPKKSGTCKVVISENEDFSDSRTFEGTYIKTPDGDRSNKVTVTELKKGTKYYYKCVTDAKETEVATFTTLSDNSFSAIYVTDIHVSYEQSGLENPLVHQSYTVDRVVADAEEKADISLLISAGDQASYGRRDEYMSVVASPLLKSIPFALCIGNHDRKNIDYRYFNNNPNKNTTGTNSFNGGDYWYVKGNVLFMVLDSNCTAASTHRSFVKKAVAANPDVKWKVVACHHDLYGRLSSGRLEEVQETRRPILTPIFDEFGIDFAFLGHSHYWSMSNVLYDGQIAESIKDKSSVENPSGTIYMVSGSINRPRRADDLEVQPECGNAFSSDLPIYNIVDFSDDSMTIKSYEYDSDEPFNTFTIYKTSKDGGHNTEYKSTFIQALRRSAYEFLAVFEEFGSGISRAWTKEFDY